MSFRSKDAFYNDTQFRGRILRMRFSDHAFHSRMPRPKRFDRSQSLRGTAWDYARSNELHVPSDRTTECFAQPDTIGMRTSTTSTVYHATCHVTKRDAGPYSLSTPEPDADDSHRSYDVFGIAPKTDRQTLMQSYGSSNVRVDEPDFAAHRSEWETCHGVTTGIYPDFPSPNHQEKTYDTQVSYDSLCDEFNELYASTFRGATSKSFSPVPSLMSSDGSVETSGEADCCGYPILGQIHLSEDEGLAYGDKKPAANGAPNKKVSQRAPAIEIAPGHFAELRGSAETWRAIQSGFIRSCSCLCCNAQLGCIHDASYVLCPDCLVVNPLEGSHGCSGGVGLGFKATIG
jgi:hypothetical protein